VRWDNLSLIPVDQPGALPFSLPGAVVRTFDTPGFAGMTFYEIQAKSIISRVPAASRMPFEYTINPYRGCSHACVYCQTGDTPILMADGRARLLADLAVGDRIIGTTREGGYRRYVETTVLAHWSTRKPAYRVTLADGTELTASGDHRYLSDRGWRFVTPGRGPFLIRGTRLIGTGAFAEPPKDTADYRMGYLTATVHSGRQARTDPEVLARTRGYLADLHLTRSDAGPIAMLTSWPSDPSDDWRKGFLAGMFDAKGTGNGSIRLLATDPTVHAWIRDCLTRLGFRSLSDGTTLRLPGGLPQRLRFLHTVDPAITRKRAIAGTAVKSTAALDVVAVTPLGLDLPMYDITTGTGDFIANGIVSHNCFARHTHEYLDLDSGHDFNTKVVVKVNAAELLRRELSGPKWSGAHIAMGTNVDCYQRAEGRYGLMRGIIAALRDHANPFSILTKGTLITRDLDLLTQAAEVTPVGISFSVGFLDEAVWRSVEPGTPSPRRRLDAVRRFVDAGFGVQVLMAPILPGLTDTEESIEATVAAIADTGASGVSPIVLHLRPGAREWYAGWLAEHHPQLVERYRSLYGKGSYAPKVYQREVSARVAEAARRAGIGRRPTPEHRGIFQRREATAPPEPVKQPEPEQLTLLEFGNPR
jgi:DNA repair photolyase